MGRRVITDSEIREAKEEEKRGIILYGEDGQKISEKKEDDAKSKIMKYIPAEITAAYVAAEASVKSVTSPTLEWIIFSILLLFTPLYLWRVGTETITKKKAILDTAGNITALDYVGQDKKIPWTQIIVGIGAFILWVFALGGPFAATWPTSPSPATYHSEYGAVALILYTVLIPIILK